MSKKSIDDLISRSSLGTPEVVAVRALAPRKIVEKILRRADELEAAQATAKKGRACSFELGARELRALARAVPCAG